MRTIDADKVIEKLKEHKSLFCKNRDEFRALSDKYKARVDEIDTCIAELVNAEEVPHAQLGTNLAEVGTDCISRQAEIDALRGYLVGKRCPDDGTLTCRLIENEVINKLPPAQPDVPDINVGDMISRQAAIDALTKDKKALEHIINGMSGYEKEFERLLYQRNQVDYDIHAIEQLPPAQPQIIRCKDCRHRDEFGCCKYWVGLTMGIPTTATDDEDFCSCAKRREVTT